MTDPLTASTPLERALALLWGRDTRGSRGPARGLTLDRIVEAAIEVAEREGPAAMSLRRVAARLGVGVASLYTYVPGRAELEALMLDAVAIGRTLPHEWPGDWRAKLTALAHDDWREIRRHPWVLELGAAEQVPGPNMLRWLDSALRIFDGDGSVRLLAEDRSAAALLIAGLIALALVIPALVMNDERRGLHEVATTSRVIRS